MEEHYIQFENVIKSYGSGNAQVNALSGVSFAIDKGEFCVLLGSSGAGKTTLLNMLGGMDTLTSGRIKFDGKEISGLGKRELIEYRRHDVGFVFQFYNLIPNLTALENVEIAAQLCKDPIPAGDALAMVGLSERASNFPAQLSGGEQQRVAVARALAHGPKLVIADEPTGNIDPEMSLEMMELLERVSEMGITVLVVTHEHELVSRFNRRVITINHGNVVGDGGIDDSDEWRDFYEG